MTDAPGIETPAPSAGVPPPGGPPPGGPPPGGPPPGGPPPGGPPPGGPPAEAPDLSHVLTMWQDDGASAHVGMQAVTIEVDHAVVRMTVGEHMVNGHDIAHGGYIFTLADSTFALVCNSRGALTVAAGADIVFVAPARRGDVLVADGVSRTAYGRSGVTDVRVTREADGAVIAEFRGRSRSLPPR